MAPSSNSPKTMLQSRPRPAVPKAIVPAIPLPYIQKRKQQLADREKEKAKDEAEPAHVEPELSPADAHAPLTETVPAVVDGSSDAQSAIRSEDTGETAHEGQSASSVTTTATAEGEHETTKEPAAPAPDEKPLEEAIEKPAHAPSDRPSDRPSSASKSTFHMPPAFVPANQNQANANAFHPAKPLKAYNNGQPIIHHAHPSTGSVVFGGYPESDNSSPAPPFPYPQQPQTGRHIPQLSNGSNPQHFTNGFSPMGPPPPGYYPRQDPLVNQVPGSDNHARRQMVSFGPADGYSPSATPLGFENARFPQYDPATPRSFHGSQSSAPNEQDNNPALYGQYPTAMVSNGSNGQIDDARQYQQPQVKPRPGTQQLGPPHGGFHPVGPPPHNVDTHDGLVPYLTNQFADAELADYVLELRYSDDRAPPVRIPGHNLLFARSPYLKTLIKAQSQESNGLAVKPLFIESEDRFLRSDGFWMAVQRLYGGPLLDLGAATMHQLPRSARQTSPMPGTPADRFDLALGYAAAGHILQVPPVINRGVEIACMLINWDTVEKALDFATDGGLDPQWTYHTKSEQSQSFSTYGPAVNMLTFNALNFIITSFPPKFELDTSVGEPPHNRRLPIIPHDRSSAVNPRLSFIKFGDHPSEDSARSESTTSIPVTLSKLLLNLPFHLLKYVLESPRLGNVEGWANNSLRQKAMHTVITERERRRTRVLASPLAPQKTEDQFDDTVRWFEAVDPQGGHEGTPVLTRTWFETGLPGSDK